MRDFELLSLMIRMLALIVAVLKDTKKQPPRVRLRLLFHKVLPFQGNTSKSQLIK